MLTQELAKICEPLGISAIPRTKYRHSLETQAVATLENIRATYGDVAFWLVARSLDVC